MLACSLGSVWTNDLLLHILAAQSLNEFFLISVFVNMMASAMSLPFPRAAVA